MSSPSPIPPQEPQRLEYRAAADDERDQMRRNFGCLADLAFGLIGSIFFIASFAFGLQTIGQVITLVLAMSGDSKSDPLAEGFWLLAYCGLAVGCAMVAVRLTPRAERK